MSKSNSIFERYEKKYVMTIHQFKALQSNLAPYMQPDRYSNYTISNIYYDTDAFDIIRTSLEKPYYKEKLRLRSYNMPESPIFMELKKKVGGIVYKRRETVTLSEANRLVHEGKIDKNTQILNEIQYFVQQYPVSEKAFICYDRIALMGTKDNELRMTFDSNIRFRQTELNLEKGNWGKHVLEPNKVLMEIKFLGVLPLWLSQMLSSLEIYPNSFSKYGACYKKYLCSNTHTEGVDMSA